MKHFQRKKHRSKCLKTSKPNLQMIEQTLGLEQITMFKITFDIFQISMKVISHEELHVALCKL